MWYFSDIAKSRSIQLMLVGVLIPVVISPSGQSPCHFFHRSILSSKPTVFGSGSLKKISSEWMSQCIASLLLMDDPSQSFALGSLHSSLADLIYSLMTFWPHSLLHFSSSCRWLPHLTWNPTLLVVISISRCVVFKTLCKQTSLKAFLWYLKIPHTQKRTCLSSLSLTLIVHLYIFIIIYVHYMYLE